MRVSSRFWAVLLAALVILALLAGLLVRQLGRGGTVEFMWNGTFA